LEVESGDVSKNFVLFKNNWETYCCATGMDKWTAAQENQKVNILLSCIGDSAKKKYSGFGFTAVEKENSTNLLNALERKIVTKRNVLFDRYIFHSCNQMDDEDFDTYLIRLRKSVEVCKYNENVTVESMIRDRIAFGVKDMSLRRSFLQADTEQLTLAKILKNVRLMS
jgi:hypothetical protein